MDLTAELVAPCAPEELFAWVADLATYPRWLGIVERVEPIEPDDLVDGEPAWIVDLAARVGPFSRSKRLRMIRSESTPPRRVVFDRSELDGRDHGTWRMHADVVGDGAESSRLTIGLHYGGRLWGPVLEPILADEIERSRGRLLDLVTGAAPQ